MGEVYKAHDLTLERPVALKVLPPSLLDDVDRVRRFVQEAKSASALNHPNIVTIYEIGQSSVKLADGTSPGDPIHYIAMEFIEGTTLRNLIYSDVPRVEILYLLAQVADGLAKAHAAGIVHRDLKPDNVMVTNDQFAKVVDFGLAKLTERKGHKSDPKLTQEGMVVGTVG
jgi:eukaryotic-like serine/threonine-protein kinase